MQSQRLEDLIRAERMVAPEAGAEARIWAAVEHRLAHGPPPPPGAEAAPAAAFGAKGILVKLVAGALLVAGGGALLASRRPDVPGDRVVAVADARAAGDPGDRSAAPEEDGGAVEPVVGAAGGEGRAGGEDAPREVSGAGRQGGEVGDVREDRAEVAPEVAPADRKSPEPDKKRRRVAPRADEAVKADAPALETDFAAELQLIGELRAAVRRGDASGALAKVEEHVRRFGSGGQLAQEREAYRVEALCAAGRTEEAKRIAEALLKRWPDTTHAPRIEQSCAGS